MRQHLTVIVIHYSKVIWCDYCNISKTSGSVTSTLLGVLQHIDEDTKLDVILRSDFDEVRRVMMLVYILRTGVFVRYLCYVHTTLVPVASLVFARCSCRSVLRF